MLLAILNLEGISLSDLQINHEYWMQYALKLAKLALNKNEVPVGAVLVHNNQAIGEGWNCQISQHDPSAHAEIIALRKGGLWMQNYRLSNTKLYVTLEPCMMCSGAIKHSRIETLIYGANDEKIGVSWREKSIIRDISRNHKLNIIGGILTLECSSLLSDFFRMRRLEKQQIKKAIDTPI